VAGFNRESEQWRGAAERRLCGYLVELATSWSGLLVIPARVDVAEPESHVRHGRHLHGETGRQQLGRFGHNTQTALISVYDFVRVWQLQYFGSTNNTPNTAADGDYTGTGMSNTNKFLAGFNPTNPAAYLHIISAANTNGTDINVIYLGPMAIAPGRRALRHVPMCWSSRRARQVATTRITSSAPTWTDVLSGGTGTRYRDQHGRCWRRDQHGPSRYYRVRVLVP